MQLTAIVDKMRVFTLTNRILLVCLSTLTQMVRHTLYTFNFTVYNISDAKLTTRLYESQVPKTDLYLRIAVFETAGWFTIHKMHYFVMWPFPGCILAECHFNLREMYVVRFYL